MSLAPCLRCSQPLGADEKVCTVCGQVVGAPQAPSESQSDPAPLSAPPAPSSLRKNGAFLVIAAGVAAFACYSGWMRFGTRAVLPQRPAPAVTEPHTSNQAPATKLAGPAAIVAPPAVLAAPNAALPVVPDPLAPVVNVVPFVSTALYAVNGVELNPHPAEAAATVPAHSNDGKTEWPPVPNKPNPQAVTFYGVIYNLATKKPVKGASISASTLSFHQARVLTDVHGRYQIEIPFEEIDGDPIDFHVQEPRFIDGALQERDPPLASSSDVRRRTVAEERSFPLPPVKIKASVDTPLVKLDLVLIPRTWPEGMPEGDFHEAVAPPVPAVPDQYNCRYYGVVYDLATKKPLRHLELAASNRVIVRTDGLGRYTLDFSLSRQAGLTITGTAAGYRPGLVAERDPVMFRMSMAQRHDIANTIDLAFDPVEMPNDCDGRLVRFDLAAVPEHWPDH
jgi:hypothetical protein